MLLVVVVVNIQVATGVGRLKRRQEVGMTAIISEGQAQLCYHTILIVLMMGIIACVAIAQRTIEADIAV